MKCQSKISPYCKETFKESQIKYIWVDGKPLEVCDNCYWIIRSSNKSTGNNVGRPREK